ncbi:hypothetical protein ES708_06562 [subsurface metagenome]
MIYLNGKSEAKLIWKGKDVSDAINRISNDRLNDLGHLLVREIREVISQKGTGRAYKRKGKVHVASAPGKPPVIWYGGLHGSIFFIVTEAGPVFLMHVGTGGEIGEYGKCLEFGTEKMAARPWLGVTLEQSRAMIKKFLEEEWF